MASRSTSLRDRFELENGPVLLTGIQALVRLALDQRRRDRAQGLRTAGFISGYRGSPLAGYDQQLWRVADLLAAHDIEFRPGLNETLAANAVWGTQQLNLFPGARHEGVFGIWYGKAPGLDQASDAIRHANAAGSSPKGGALLVVGDDHACKSSTFPSQSEYALMDLEVPILNPAGVAEVLRYGLLGIAMSRFSGAWVALIALTDAMDSTETVVVSSDEPRIVMPDGAALGGSSGRGLGIRLHDTPQAQEARTREKRIPAALAFARANGINQIVLDCPRARLGLVATGKSYLDLRQAMSDLGIDDAVAAELGLRVLKVGMPWPLDGEIVARFARGLEEIAVIEEKRPLLETQIRDLLYALPDAERPRVVGKRDATGQPLLPATYELTSGRIALLLDSRLPGGCPTERGIQYVAELEAREHAAPAQAFPARSPFFCSGCPHNTSTRVPDGSRALVGIGCHYMVQWMDRSSATFSQMGGEGAAWIGQQPFTDEKHVFVNLGDGTYQHSGVLAIRAAVAAKVPVTYKILVNGAVAMTGGQPVDGEFDVPQLSRQLASEGVKRIVLVADDPKRYSRDSGLAAGTEIVHRDRMEAVQKELREYPGVSVLIYDQLCAAETRRKRKRGLMEDPARHVVINERVCEGCGDCADASNCLSVEPVETELGTKRRINHSSCNKDETCLKGLCPSFVIVKGGRLRQLAPPDVQDRVSSLPAPELPAIERSYDLVLTGIGGTGVTTIAALLAMAAHLEDKASATLDMTGLAQKGGGVLSHVRLARRPEDIAGPRVPPAGADVLLAFDALGAVHPGAHELLATERTVSIANERTVPTAELVLDADRHISAPALIDAIRRTSRATHAVDALGICELLFGDSIAANVFLLGFAYQKGALPLQLDSIDRAIELNAVSVELNRRAFAWGRLVAHDEKVVKDLIAVQRPERAPRTLDERIAYRAEFLTQYQDAAYARRYVDLVERVRRAEQAIAHGPLRLTDAVTHGYFKLLAYKDEYEVARLYTDGEFEARLRAQFEGDFEVEYQLAPPLWAKRDPETGRLRKSRYGRWIVPAFRALAALRVLRGSWLDVFGYLPERRAERAWIAHYEATLEQLLAGLRAENLELAREIAALPERLRGYDVIKERNGEQVKAREQALLEKFRAGPPR